MSTRIRLPRAFYMDSKSARNSVRQLSSPITDIEADIASYRAPKIRGTVLTPKHSDDEILFVSSTRLPTTQFKYVIRTRKKLTIGQGEPIDLSGGSWLKHPAIPTKPLDNAQLALRVHKVVDSWKDAFSFLPEDREKGRKGLRPPQIGAIHSLHAHWTVSDDVATVVMPTGTGKTETMLSILVSCACQRVLVIVPTDALRAQIAEKFLSLGILKDSDCHVLASDALRPIVCVVGSKPKTTAEVDELFLASNVIVTTSHIAGQCDSEVRNRMAHHCPFLFIDEAHHAEAPTWRRLRDSFGESRIVQFTATPFREDGKPLDGKIIFKYPLRKAQQENYYQPIRFRPVLEFDPQKADIAIAEEAVRQLHADQPLKHILMARVATVTRAEAVFQIYKRFQEFNPVQIHTGIKSKAAREKIRSQIINGHSRIVICVDMLGEGFDLPALKIAAFHDIRKSLAVTLQLAGRFTRAREDVGQATFIANIADVHVKGELRKLYTQDPDWNLLLPDLSENVIEQQVGLQELVAGFNNFPSEIPLSTIRPAASAVVYKTKCRSWTPENFRKGIPGIASFDQVHFDVNPDQNALIIVTAERVAVPWTDVDEVFTLEWTLFVAIWDEERNLLYINNSGNDGVFRRLARALAGDDVELVDGQDVFRSFAGVTRLKLQNVGLTEQRGRLIRYTGRMGADVESGLSDAQKKNSIKSVLAGTGFKDGRKISVGASRKGRIWSFNRPRLDSLISWCETIGAQVIDDTIDPEEILKGTLESIAVDTLPTSPPIAIDWPESFYSELETAVAISFSTGEIALLLEVGISLLPTDRSDQIAFSISSDSSIANGTFRLVTRNGSPDYSISEKQPTFIEYRSKRLPLSEFFYQNPPIIWFADGASLEGNSYTPLKSQSPGYDRDKIVAWDWTDTDLTKESQGIRRDPSSIQYRVVDELRSRGDFVVIFDDDGSGEAADVVACKPIEESGEIKAVHVEFYHCKYTKDKPGRRIGDLYEVCGQAQKSIRWMYNHEKQIELFTHLLRRETKRQNDHGSTRFEVGDNEKLYELREMARSRPLNLSIFIVQPGLSKSKATSEQLELLGVTENYLLETYKLPFRAIASP